MNVPDISTLITRFPYAGLFLVLVLGGVGLPFPEDAALMLCGVLISAGVIEAAYAIPTVYTGMLIGDFLLYLAGRKWGRRIVTRGRFRRILSPERFSRLEQKFRKNEFLFIFFGRHFLGLRAQIFLVSGIMRMPPVKFVLTDAFTAVFTMTVMIGAGYIGGNSLNILRKDIGRVEHIAILALAAMVPLYLAYRYLKNRKRPP